MPKRSNEKRLRLKQQCREALAANICICGPHLIITQLILLDDRLRIVVAPEKVRLQPRPEDGYAWSVTSANAGVLKSSLSSGKIHLYRKFAMSSAIQSRLFHRTRWDTLSQIRAAEGIGEGMDGSFTAEIPKLRAANSSIKIELECTRARLKDCLDEIHTSHNKKLHDEQTEARAGIAGARRILNSLQTEGIEIALGTRDIQSSANGIHGVASEV
ncbi:unnamed protein product, partial [Penicillium nalgiovense]